MILDFWIVFCVFFFVFCPLFGFAVFDYIYCKKKANEREIMINFICAKIDSIDNLLKNDL